ncbi:MAG: nodulation protein NodH, partial [Rhodobacteraceae bacterium]|nr:nodulation protein NodH [Paracoccaceae bacterium]
FSQSGLRDWMRAKGPVRRFAVLRHPLLRAFAAFEQLMGPEGDPELRRLLAKSHKVMVADPALLEEQRAGFAAFLKFLRANLNGQTAVRGETGWASQTAFLQGIQQFLPCDLLAREERLGADLAHLCAALGLACPALPAEPDPLAARLAALHDDRLEALARQAYARDYLNFGFGDWA